MGKITDQTDGGAGLSTDEFVINRGGADFKLTLANVIKASTDAIATEITDRAAADTTLTNTKVNKAGDTLTGFLILHATPTLANHAADKQYVDLATTGKLSTTGGTMTGALILAADPAAALEPVTKQYLEGSNGVGGRWKITSDVDCSASPNYSASSAGDTYRVSVAGKIGGASGIVVQVDDIIYCHTTSAAGDQATVGANFTIIQTNIVQASTTENGYITLAGVTDILGIPTENTKAVTPAIMESRLAVVSPGHSKTITASTTINVASSDGSKVYFCTATSSSAVTVNLPAISTLDFPNLVINIKDAGFSAGTNNITVNAGGSDLIDGASSYVIDTNYESITLVNDGGTNWYNI